MKALQPLIKEIEDQNTKLLIGDEETKDLKDKMNEGEDLVGELSAWSLRTPLCTSQLVEFDDSCQRQLEILNVQGIRDVKDVHTQQLNNCKSDVKESLDLAKDHKDQLDDCKSDVKEMSAWTSKTTDQLVEVASDGKENLGLARKVDTAINRLELLGLVQVDKVASSMERAALEAAVESLSGAVYKKMQNGTSSLAQNFWDRIYYLSKTALGEWFAKNRAVEENVWDGIAFEELKGFRIQIEQGVELARKWCNVRVWNSEQKG